MLEANEIYIFFYFEVPDSDVNKRIFLNSGNPGGVAKPFRLFSILRRLYQTSRHKHIISKQDNKTSSIVMSSVLLFHLILTFGTIIDINIFLDRFIYICVWPLPPIR